MSNLNLTTGAGDAPNPGTMTNFAGMINPGSFTPPQPNGSPAETTANVTAGANTYTCVQQVSTSSTNNNQPTSAGPVVVPVAVAQSYNLENGFGSVAPYGQLIGSAGYGDQDSPSGNDSFRANMATETYVSAMMAAARDGAAFNFTEPSPALNIAETIPNPPSGSYVQEGTPQINAPVSISSGVAAASLQTFKWE
jgi:hypothetical protein